MKSFLALKLFNVMRHVSLIRTFRFFVALVLCFISVSAVSAEPLRFKEQDWNENFLRILDRGPSILSASHVFHIPEFPPNESATTREELRYLKEEAYDLRSPITTRLIHFENSDAVSIPRLFLTAGLVDLHDYKTIRLIEYVDREFMYFVLREKKRLMRARPSQLDTSLETLIPNPRHPAYPSGHAGQSYIVSLVLSDFDTEHAEFYQGFARDVAARREIAGVHYPSDSHAGQILAEQVLAALKNNTVFQRKYDDAKQSFIGISDEIVQALKDGTHADIYAKNSTAQ